RGAHEHSELAVLRLEADVLERGDGLTPASAEAHREAVERQAGHVVLGPPGESPLPKRPSSFTEERTRRDKYRHQRPKAAKSTFPGVHAVRPAAASQHPPSTHRASIEPEPPSPRLTRPGQ